MEMITDVLFTIEPHMYTQLLEFALYPLSTVTQPEP